MGLSTALALGGSAMTAVAARFAHQLVTPAKNKPNDVCVVDVTDETITFITNTVSAAPGRYGLYWDDERGHAQIGDVLDLSDAHVTRKLLRVTRGSIAPGPARMSSYFYAKNPGDEFGLPCEEIMLATPVGQAPSWVVRSGDGSRWAVLIHGRGARRFEVMRAVPVLASLDISCIIPSYRNDQEAPASEDGRYGLGLREWRDVEAALDFAASQGAKTIDLLGWSMGGAIALQLARKSRHTDKISRVFLDGPALDWRDVMRFHAAQHRLPGVIDALSARLMANPYMCRLAGLSTPVDVRGSIVTSDHIQVPTLIVHSMDDDFVPAAPSQELARLKPEFVRWSRWEGAGHVREWNAEPQRWEREVREFFAD